MKDEKQIIEEMAKDVTHSISWCDEVIPTVDCLGTAAALYGIGYRKQIEGEWIYLPDYGNGWYQNGQKVFPKSCSVCGGVVAYGPYKFCPNCGAKMKGGAQK